MAHYEFERKAFDGLRLYFQEWQAEENQKGVLSLVHGLGEHSGRYSSWAARLNLAGYSMLAYDLRGHGKSGGKRGHLSSFTECMEDMSILMEETEARFPGSPHFIYGHSIGAVISVNYVLRRKPVLAGVILSGYPSKSSVAEQKVKVFMAKVMGKILPEVTLASGLDPATISKDPEIVSAYINDPLVHDKITLGYGVSMMEGIAWADQHASEWTLPVLIMHGEEDKLGYAIGSREFASKIHADCTLKIWPGMYHEIHNEPGNDQVFDFLRNWLDEHLQA